jgi:predicted transcriptional regulator
MPPEPAGADRLLTDAELPLMHTLWDRGSATARAVHDALPPGDGRAYTTVATILKIMEDKGFLRSDRDGRAAVYTPTLSREAYEARNIKRVVDEVFRGDGKALVRQLARSEALPAAEREALAALLGALEP